MCRYKESNNACVREKLGGNLETVNFSCIYWVFFLIDDGARSAVPMIAVLVLVLLAAVERLLVGLQKDSGFGVSGGGACGGAEMRPLQIFCFS